jgi:DNA-binding LacI/PurR family transcriptional regulator
MPVTQRDIASKLNVSVSLVSRVLSGQGNKIGIAPETEKKVIDTAKKMGYVPSAAALTLKGKSSLTIGVVVYDFLDPFFNSAVSILHKLAHKNGYSLVLAGFRNRKPEETDLRPLQKHSIDGLIAIGSNAETDWLKKFKNIPVARIGHDSNKTATICCSLDEEDAARQLINHAKEKNCNSISFLMTNLITHQLRAKALEKFASDKGCKLTIHQSDLIDSFIAGFKTTKELIKSNNLPDVIMCATDQIAIGVLNALSEAGIEVPQKVKVTGYDDIPMAARFLPAITTIRQPLEQLVETAFQAIINKDSNKHEYFKGELIIRSSC